jgi:hypothetical protein
MIQYKSTRQQSYCEYCSTCAKRRKLAYYAYADDAEIADEYEKEATDDEKSSSIDCSSYSSKCENYSNVCSGDDASSTDLSEYVTCSEVAYGNKAFWIGPFCDEGTIIMGIFYDPYCSQYAGSSVKISEVTGKSFSKSLFSQYYSTDCISCASDSAGPYGTASSIMCNNLYNESAKCNTNMASQVDTSYDNDQSTCTFADTIRYSAYDSDGRFTSARMSGARRANYAQIVLIVIACVSCALLSVYSCYVHHEITNLLLKQLSARGKLVPSSGTSRGRAGYYSKSSVMSNDDEDSRVMA